MLAIFYTSVSEMLKEKVLIPRPGVLSMFFIHLYGTH